MTFKTLFSGLSGLLFMLTASFSLAQEQNYFEASVAVRSQNTQERQYAAQKALQEVLIRMSGSRQVLESAEVQATIDKAQNYVEQFQYSENSDPEEVAKGKKQIITMAFSPSAVEKLLRNTGQPFWPVNRPTTLVWLVEDTAEEGKQFVSESSSPDIINSFQLAAAKRGLPLVYPLYDLEDRIVLNEEKVWSLDEESILQASKRYKADAILVGRFSMTSQGQYFATWQFFHRGETRVYDSRTEDLMGLGENSLFPLADYFASRYSILPQAGENPMLVVQLTGINGFGSFRQALDYLDGLAIVSDVAIAAVRRDTLLLYLQSDSSLERFESTLGLDRKLVIEKSNELSFDVPVWQQIPRGTMNNPLQYKWAG